MATKHAQLVPDLPEVETGKLALWMTDDELAARPEIGLPRDTFRQVTMMYDSDPKSGFPRKVAIYGNRRYWPAILDFWEAIYRPKVRTLGSLPHDR